MSWRLAKSLVQLREQINAAHPNRNKESDGSIGDAAHSARVSDHNPDGQGRVCAIDVTHDPSHGVDGMVLSRQLINDPRVKYVIFSGQIWKQRSRKWEPYRGANAHNHHVHVSVSQVDADNEGPWPLNGEAVPEILKLGSKGSAVRSLQEKLKAFVNITADGVFGPVTEKSVKFVQRSKGLAETGQVDQATWEALK